MACSCATAEGCNVAGGGPREVMWSGWEEQCESVGRDGKGTFGH